MHIEITKNGTYFMKMSTDQFMAVAKENFGIGRNQFLQVYINRYNELYKEEGLVAEVKIK